MCDLASRVRVEIDPEMDAVYPELYAGKVTIVTKAGKRITKRIDYSKGMPENPMDAQELEEKFFSLASLAIGADKAHQTLTSLNQVFKSPQITDFCERLGTLQITARA